MKSSFINLKKSFMLFLFFSIISCSLLSPHGSLRFAPSSTDFVNHITAIIYAKNGIEEGQFPLREMISDIGYRYPFFQFYSPTSYMLTGAIYKLFFSQPHSAYKFMLWFANVLGGIYMYKLARWLLQSTPAAILTSVIYLSAPYLLIVNNHLFGFNEGLALGVLPAVLFYTFQRYQNFKSTKLLLQMSIAWYLLITIHLITFIYTAISLGILFSFITLKNPNHRKNLYALCTACLLTGLLAMWFLAPIFLQAKTFIINKTFSQDTFASDQAPFLGLISFTANYLFNFKPIFVAQIIPAIGWITLLGAGLSCYLLFIKKKFNCLRATYFQPYLLFIFFISFFLAWAPFNIWQHIPSSLKIGQYSWRVLSQASWTGALSAGYALNWLTHRKLSLRHIMIGTLIILAAESSWIPSIDKTKMLIPNNFSKHPVLITNQVSYLIDTSDNFNLINLIDNVTLRIPINNSQPFMLLNKQYILPKILIDQAKNPIIVLKGNIAKNTIHQTIQATLNKKNISILTLKPGNFTWSIPINKAYASDQILEFKLVNSTQLNELGLPSVFLSSIVLAGFNTSDEMMSAETLQKKCLFNHSMTTCNIIVNNKTHLLELPVHYYPDMLRVTVNGKSTPYDSMLKNGFALTTIQPDVDKFNKITVQFVGLQWANYVSAATWISVFFLMIYLILVSNKRLDKGKLGQA
ncbi:MAG: hypothetical protein P4M12_08210 [Gammaproteobacteria bacterium]|nr:hypothetical protein [Gammaproteobacteria bacterium]